MQEPSRSWVKFLLKFSFVAVLLWFLVQKGFISLHATGKAFGHLELIVPASLALLLNIFMGSIRWQWLLNAQGIHLPFLRTLELTLIGNFFNVALPGAVSGDFVKAFYIGKELEGQRAKSFGSIIFDRVAGLSALVLVSASTLFLEARVFKQHLIAKPILFSVWSAALGVIVFYTYLFLVKESHDPLLIFFRKLESKVSKMGSVTRIYLGLRHYHSYRWTVLKVLFFSVMIHLIVGWSCLQFARALGQGDLTVWSLYMVVPIGLLVTAIPVMPAGVGTGHAAFLYLFTLIGSERGADVFTLLAMFNLLIGAVGGVVYLKFKSSPKLMGT